MAPSRISVPLEAGTSILDAHKLPSYLVPALGYTSQRLALKGLHVTLVMARRGYQLPNIAGTNDVALEETAAKDEATPDNFVYVTNLASPPTSPTSPDTVGCGPSFTTIKTMVRSRSQHNLRSADRPDTTQPQRGLRRSLSKKASLASLFEGGLRGTSLRRSPTSATASQRSKTSKIPKTPATPSSLGTTTSSNVTLAAANPTGLQEHEIRLMHTTPLTPRAYKLVAATLVRATRKFNLTTPLTVHEPSTYNIPPVVLHSSILQNNVLHSSEGLTLVSLDHLYTFKAALNRYAAVQSEFGSHVELEDAVDELRRYVLSGSAGRRRLLKSTLISAYDWMGPVDETALADVMNMYSRAYGGAKDTGVEDDLVKADRAPAVAATMALAKAMDDSAGLRVVEPSPAPRPQPGARLSRMSINTAATSAPTASPPVSPWNQSDATSAPSLYSPASIHSQPLSTPMPPDNWVAEDYSPWADEGMASLDSSIVETPVVTPATGEAIDAPVEEREIAIMEDLGLKTPAEALVEPKEELPHLSPPLPPASVKNPSPVTSHKASLPTLRIQTNFPVSIRSSSQRRTTPMPHKHLSRRRLSADIISPAEPVSPATEDIRIQISIPVTPDEADLTDFEDAELTARSPVKTPGGSLLLGIDDILSSYPKPWEEKKRRHYHHRWTSSSLREMQTPVGEKLGPATPNGYDDISPITRGEWGALMVGDQFRTKTAAVSCV